MIECMYLGQSGIRLNFNGKIIYIDPYLSNSVKKIEGIKFNRLVPIKINPKKIYDACFVLITHIHKDHCDLETLLPIALNSKDCIFIAPKTVCKFLIKKGIEKNRFFEAKKVPITLTKDIKIFIIPAAHPTIKYDKDNNLENVGFILDFKGEGKIYHSGDTFLNNEIVKKVLKFMPIKTAMLPINEHNYFKEQNGIIGNMTMREAFQFASLINVKNFIPMHWDIFEINSVTKEEIKLLYKVLKPKYKLYLDPIVL
jgi:L-ascorbate 6-phosphate lactonase